jgi:hypothetical protein
MKSIYDLHLFEILYCPCTWVGKVIRVPGAWLIDGTFVPFNDEFSEMKKKKEPIEVHVLTGDLS